MYPHAIISGDPPAYSRFHVINEDDLLTWLKHERWQEFAACSTGPRQLSVMVNGSAFLVTMRGEVVYRGQNASDAVRAYNEAV
jgi:hypothetical protein